MNDKGIISLLGCGWLGFPLAINLLSEGYRIKASTTTEGKLDVMSKAGIDPYLVHFSSSSPTAQFKPLLEAHTLIISIPPGRNNPEGFESYRQMVRALCKEVPGTGIAHIILVSSTSVYPEVNDMVDEFTAIDPDTESGKLMEQTEALISNLPVNVIIVRLAGLIGPQRMPGRFFAGKNNIPNGLAAVNLIHRNDAIRLILLLIKNDHASGIYNGCAPSHPSRTEFYTLAAQKENLAAPHFINEKIRWKTVVSKRTMELGFKFEFSSLMQFLKSL